MKAILRFFINFIDEPRYYFGCVLAFCMIACVITGVSSLIAERILSARDVTEYNILIKDSFEYSGIGLIISVALLFFINIGYLFDID